MIEFKDVMNLSGGTVEELTEEEYEERMELLRQQDMDYKKYVEELKSGTIKCDYFGTCDGMVGTCVDCSEYRTELWEKCRDYRFSKKK